MALKKRSERVLAVAIPLSIFFTIAPLVPFGFRTTMFSMSSWMLAPLFVFAAFHSFTVSCAFAFRVFAALSLSPLTHAFGGVIHGLPLLGKLALGHFASLGHFALDGMPLLLELAALLHELALSHLHFMAAELFFEPPADFTDRI